MTSPVAPPGSSTPPADRGFRMPAEWQRHAVTWTSWPFDEALWGGVLKAVRAEFAQLVATIARFEPVRLNVAGDEAEATARAYLRELLGDGFPNLDFRRLPLDDVWFRDNGPTFVRDGEGRIALIDWRFNGWGRKYPWHNDARAPATVAAELGMTRFPAPLVMEGGALDVNDRGVCLTTRQCLLNPNRNPGLSREEIDRALQAHLGVDRVVWLEEGLEGDHTDGHVDTIVRFCDDATIVCAVEGDAGDVNFAPTQRNLELLQGLRDASGRPYRVVPLPLPADRRQFAGERLPLTYANFYIGNGFVVVPTYDDANDGQALEILRPLFPGREVIGLPAANLITGGGAFHCVTQQQPAGEVHRG